MCQAGFRPSRKEDHMKAMNIITLVLIIIGGINWGLVALFRYDLVAALFGGQDAALALITYLLIGLSALWQLYPLTLAFQTPGIPHQRFRA
jgi:hypothetical protein